MSDIGNYFLGPAMQHQSHLANAAENEKQRLWQTGENDKMLSLQYTQHQLQKELFELNKKYSEYDFDQRVAADEKIQALNDQIVENQKRLQLHKRDLEAYDIANPEYTFMEAAKEWFLTPEMIWNPEIPEDPGSIYGKGTPYNLAPNPQNYIPNPEYKNKTFDYWERKLGYRPTAEEALGIGPTYEDNVDFSGISNIQTLLQLMELQQLDPGYIASRSNQDLLGIQNQNYQNLLRTAYTDNPTSYQVGQPIKENR